MYSIGSEIEKIEVETLSTTIPTPLAHNLIVLGDADVVLMEDGKKRLLQLHEAVMNKLRKIELG